MSNLLLVELPNGRFVKRLREELLAGDVVVPDGQKSSQKYKNRRCFEGDQAYRSELERDRHQELLLLERAGHIAGLTREVPFELAPGVVIQGRKRPPVRYFADFVYSTADGRIIVEDAKGMRTPSYKLKRHFMKHIHNIDILET